LPKIKQADLLKTIVNQFSLLISTNTLSKEVSFIPLDKLIDNIGIAIDWSDKIDLSEEHEVLYNFFENYFQKNWLIYKDDDKDTNIAGSGLGNSYLLFSDENAQLDGTLFESEFSAISRVEVDGVQLATSPFYPSEDLNPKLGVSKITSDNLIQQIYEAAPTQSNEIFFNDISFAKLLATNFEALKRVLANGIAIKILVRLTRSDFTNIDFSIPIFLDVMTAKGQLRGHFYINEISQYNVGANDSCEVTLIQID